MSHLYLTLPFPIHAALVGADGGPTAQRVRQRIPIFVGTSSVAVPHDAC